MAHQFKLQSTTEGKVARHPAHIPPDPSDQWPVLEVPLLGGDIDIPQR